jgi:hypothetical protein
MHDSKYLIFWRKCLFAKTRESFANNDWVVLRAAASMHISTHVYHVIDHTLSGKLKVTQYNVNGDNGCINIKEKGIESYFSKGSAVKAIILSLSLNSSRKCDALLFYSGNYNTSKLLLSRLSWPGESSCSLKISE